MTDRANKWFNEYKPPEMGTLDGEKCYSEKQVKTAYELGCQSIEDKSSKQVRHKKTGNIYWIIAQDIIECTNGREELKYVLYENIVGQLFCREQNEFWVKFENA